MDQCVCDVKQVTGSDKPKESYRLTLQFPSAAESLQTDKVGDRPVNVVQHLAEADIFLRNWWGAKQNQKGSKYCWWPGTRSPSESSGCVKEPPDQLYKVSLLHCPQVAKQLINADLRWPAWRSFHASFLSCFLFFSPFVFCLLVSYFIRNHTQCLL